MPTVITKLPRISNYRGDYSVTGEYDNYSIVNHIVGGAEAVWILEVSDSDNIQRSEPSDSSTIWRRLGNDINDLFDTSGGSAIYGYDGQAGLTALRPTSNDVGKYVGSDNSNLSLLDGPSGGSVTGYTESFFSLPDDRYITAVRQHAYLTDRRGQAVIVNVDSVIANALGVSEDYNEQAADTVSNCQILPFSDDANTYSNNVLNAKLYVCYGAVFAVSETGILYGTMNMTSSGTVYGLGSPHSTVNSDNAYWLDMLGYYDFFRPMNDWRQLSEVVAFTTPVETYTAGQVRIRKVIPCPVAYAPTRSLAQTYLNVLTRVVCIESTSTETGTTGTVWHLAPGGFGRFLTPGMYAVGVEPYFIGHWELVLELNAGGSIRENIVDFFWGGNLTYGYAITSDDKVLAMSRSTITQISGAPAPSFEGHTYYEITALSGIGVVEIASIALVVSVTNSANAPCIPYGWSGNFFRTSSGDLWGLGVQNPADPPTDILSPTTTPTMITTGVQQVVSNYFAGANSYVAILKSNGTAIEVLGKLPGTSANNATFTAVDFPSGEVIKKLIAAPNMIIALAESGRVFFNSQSAEHTLPSLRVGNNVSSTGSIEGNTLNNYLIIQVPIDDVRVEIDAQDFNSTTGYNYRITLLDKFGRLHFATANGYASVRL